MTRPVDEWIGKKPESKIPARVRVRVFAAQDGRCALCGKKMAQCGEPFEVDHIMAMILGGENREGNLRALCGACHKAKTRQDVAQKSTESRKRAKHLGVKKPTRKIPYRTADGRCHWNGKE